jgi:uncharacterized membrane protein YhaH (DUF805 family)
LDYKTLLLSAKGRVNRKAYWLSTVGILLALAVAWGIAGASMAMASSEDGGMSALGTPGPNRFGADPLGTLSTRFATA